MLGEDPRFLRALLTVRIATILTVEHLFVVSELDVAAAAVCCLLSVVRDRARTEKDWVVVLVNKFKVSDPENL